jgi:hypothetical protein
MKMLTDIWRSFARDACGTQDNSVVFSTQTMGDPREDFSYDQRFLIAPGRILDQRGHETQINPEQLLEEPRKWNSSRSWARIGTKMSGP